jgi:hypothetical protein
VLNIYQKRFHSSDGLNSRDTVQAVLALAADLKGRAKREAAGPSSTAIERPLSKSSRTKPAELDKLCADATAAPISLPSAAAVALSTSASQDRSPRGLRLDDDPRRFSPDA